MPILSGSLQAVDAPVTQNYSTKGAVTLNDEVYSRLASLEGFAKPSSLKRTGSASMSLSNWPHCRYVMAGMRTRDIALSRGSSKFWMYAGQSSQEIGPPIF